jgi:hypothetical protein
MLKSRLIEHYIFRSTTEIMIIPWHNTQYFKATDLNSAEILTCL